MHTNYTSWYILPCVQTNFRQLSELFCLVVLRSVFYICPLLLVIFGLVVNRTSSKSGILQPFTLFHSTNGLGTRYCRRREELGFTRRSHTHNRFCFIDQPALPNFWRWHRFCLRSLPAGIGSSHPRLFGFRPTSEVELSLKSKLVHSIADPCHRQPCHRTVQGAPSVRLNHEILSESW